jgi:hypothetical protein
MLRASYKGELINNEALDCRNMADFIKYNLIAFKFSQTYFKFFLREKISKELESLEFYL